jgi:hypothetical protein
MSTALKDDWETIHVQESANEEDDLKVKVQYSELREKFKIVASDGDMKETTFVEANEPPEEDEITNGNDKMKVCAAAGHVVNLILLSP